jgi:hypothetical protein
MEHFENLPTITYSPSNSDITAEMKNLFFTLDLTVQDNNSVQLYVIEGVKRLDNISYELYNSTEHWWIIAKLNNITDIIFDLPISEDILQKIALDRTLDQESFDSIDDPGALDYYIEQFEELVLENDNKRQISVIKPSYMNNILTEIIKTL